MIRSVKKLAGSNHNCRCHLLLNDISIVLFSNTIIKINTLEERLLIFKKFFKVVFHGICISEFFCIKNILEKRSFPKVQNWDYREGVNKIKENFQTLFMSAQIRVQPGIAMCKITPLLLTEALAQSFFFSNVITSHNIWKYRGFSLLKSKLLP